MKTPDERKEFLRRLQLAASEADDMLGSCDASDILDSLEESRDYMFESANLIEQLEAQVPRWIPVEERLPESKPPYFQTVNVYTVNGEVLVGFCNRGFWYVMRTEYDYCNDAEEGEVTHWMPLPQGPKDDGHA